jgi:hypothetical protein
MKIRELIEILEKLPGDMQIFIAVTNGDSCEVVVAPVTESCADDTVIGYMVTDMSTEVH